MTDQDFKNYLREYDKAVHRYAVDNGITPEEVVDMINIGELSIK